MGADQNSPIVFPLPIDLVEPFLEQAAGEIPAAANENGHAALPPVASPSV